jgi:hypothetical protein
MVEDEGRKGWLAALRERLARYYWKKPEGALEGRYRAGYAEGDALGPEFEGWEREGVWPDE